MVVFFLKEIGGFLMLNGPEYRCFGVLCLNAMFFLSVFFLFKLGV